MNAALYDVNDGNEKCHNNVDDDLMKIAMIILFCSESP